MAVVLATRVAEVPPPRGGTVHSVVRDELGIYIISLNIDSRPDGIPKEQSEQSSCFGSRRLRSRYHAYSSFLGRRPRLLGIYQEKGQWRQEGIFAGRERRSTLGRFLTTFISFAMWVWEGLTLKFLASAWINGA